ncbi:tag-294 [Pristionchus pacificus]|uniref:Tag-294 protein n=1 Tax=Pristionchus pacificus TaxID=54126 RepID=A0A2A6BEU3_PRIPA|nr:tag-294 [Pristionchus pacificus]|eukprot:PDM64376.1 tag-294 protein [Pristionchus pacificus]
MASAKKKAKKERIDDGDADEGTAWDCTVCTFKNKSEAFKCEICDTRKGTSTRKSRLTHEVQQMQSAVHHLVLQNQKIPPISHKRKTQLSGGSPSNSRNSPESTSSGSVPKGNGNGSKGVKKRKPVPISDTLIFRSSPRKMTVTLEKSGISAIITEFKAK